MPRSLALAVLLLAAAPSRAQPVRRAAGFPGQFTASFQSALQAEPFYASRFLNAFSGHLAQVGAMNRPEVLKDYLLSCVFKGEGGVGDARRLQDLLGRKPLPAEPAAALLLANALARPDQFQPIVKELDRLKPGLAGQVRRLLSQASGSGSRSLLARLHEVGSGVSPHAEEPLTYDLRGRFNRFFDGGGASALDEAQADAVAVPAAYTGLRPDGRPRPSGLLPAPRPRD